ncbi:MAG TPA: UDP-N-acetylmuramate--L-alanine ligase [Fibrobacteria bacterium]|nr:UDP-N-acetylmuramate--L-alanine ligase [Fibrobacteria bacterium]HOX51941.1 UDP-N-acetylmuramate--L-alanine ligase [Fibrobacteria bacterium]
MIPLNRFPRLHFTGIGGAGMAPLAAWHAARGFVVTGTDREESSNLAWLRSLGVDARAGHDPSLACAASLVVRTSAVPLEHPEIAAALKACVPVVRRAEALGEVTRSSRALCIAGTHGKTTTTLMLGRILREAGLDPCVLPGGVPSDPQDAIAPGANGPLVVETDEFDRTFLRFHPDVAVVTNLEEDHLDCYEDLADLDRTFRQFLSKLPFHGRAFLCQDDAGSRGLAAGLEAEAMTYGFSDGARLRGVDLGEDSFEVRLDGRFLTKVSLAIAGRHNRLNALAALGVAVGEGVDPDIAAKALAGFRGARRRLDFVGSRGGCPVVEDYAHHPTELSATLQALRESQGGRRIAIVFQPHLYSRTAHFARAFAQALDAADLALVAPVYPARETPEQGLPSSAIAERALPGSRLELVSGRTEAFRRMADLALQGDWVLVFAGAGDVGSWAREFAGGEP